MKARFCLALSTSEYGCRFLEEQGYPLIGELILGHGCAPEQASIRGLDGVTSSDHIIAKLVTYWDMHVKMDGEIVSYEERMRYMVARLGTDAPLVRAQTIADNRIRGILREIDGLLGYSINGVHHDSSK